MDQDACSYNMNGDCLSGGDTNNFKSLTSKGIKTPITTGITFTAIGGYTISNEDVSKKVLTKEQKDCTKDIETILMYAEKLIKNVEKLRDSNVLMNSILEEALDDSQDIFGMLYHLKLNEDKVSKVNGLNDDVLK